MKFKEAFKEMKSGLAVKLPSWAGYWWWDEEAQTILMYTKDGGCLDIRETPIYFVSSDDVAEYLATAQVTMQTAFGISYIQDFLGLGTVVIAPSLTKGKLVATAKENLRGAYVPAQSSDLAQSFGLTADSTGLIGMTHAVSSDNATIDTLMFSSVVFYPELLDGVIVATIKAAEAASADAAAKK